MSLHVNSGAPMGRSHTERIVSSLLGRSDGFIRCPCVLQAGIIFGSVRDQVKAVEALLGEAGCRSAEELRDIFNIPPRILIARPAGPTCRPCELGKDAPEIVLRNALILGLSTAQIFNPARPVLWTEASLSRQLEFFEPEGFYQ